VLQIAFVCAAAAVVLVLAAGPGVVLDRRVPPGIEMDDEVRCREIETGAASFQADEEEIAVAGLKCRYTRSALLRRHGAVEVLVTHATGIERLAHLVALERLVDGGVEALGGRQQGLEFVLVWGAAGGLGFLALGYLSAQDSASRIERSALPSRADTA